jgi:hypothetical protein
VEVPRQFDADTEFGLTEMQTAFVWHYSQGRVRPDGGCEKGRLQLPRDERQQADERA